jgi:23S rRNA (uracil1939-C5)-methyltransferase
MTMAIELTIEKLVYGGEGLGRVEGRVVLTSLVLPGERVAVEPFREDPRLVRARLKEVLEASPQRITPHCPYFGRCGGCHYQHASYEDQLKFKAAIVAENLKRLGKLQESPEPEILAGEPWAYRNRTQFKVHKRGGHLDLGFFRAGSQQLLAVDECPISSPGINSLIPVLKSLGGRPDFPEGPLQVEVLDGGAQVLLNIEGAAQFPETLVSAFREHVPALASMAVAGRIYGAGHVVYEAAGFRFRISHGVFFQTNRYLVEKLAAAALEGLSGSAALDLYAGAGYFTLPLARQFGKVVAVESQAAAIRDLNSNLSHASLENVETVRSSTEDFLARKHLPQVDAVLLDPPRAGLEKAAAERLAALGAPRVVYVSCDPATLARDLGRLVSSGYKLQRLLLVDLFPQTFHIESVAFLEK